MDHGCQSSQVAIVTKGLSPKACASLIFNGCPGFKGFSGILGSDCWEVVVSLLLCRIPKIIVEIERVSHDKNDSIETF